MNCDGIGKGKTSEALVAGQKTHESKETAQDEDTAYTRWTKERVRVTLDEPEGQDAADGCDAHSDKDLSCGGYLGSGEKVLDSESHEDEE